MSSPTQRSLEARRSDAGRPRLPFEENFWRRVSVTDGCWVWNGPLRPNGYGQVTRRGRNISAHRVAYELVNGPVPEGAVLRHTCDNRRCVSPRHLVPGTQRENARDMVERQRSLTGDRNPMRVNPGSVLRGADNGNSKLTPEIASEIRRVRAVEGLSLALLARRFGVCKRTVQLVLSGRRWA